MDADVSNLAGRGNGVERSVDALLVGGEPDWDVIDFEVICSRCGYNLRLLPEPRCPECGLRFDWRSVLDAWSRRSDFLFEHNWRARPIGSWLKTLWRSSRPFRFWRGVSIHDYIKPGPLWFLLLTSIFWFMVTLHGMAGLGWLILASADRLSTKAGSASYSRLDKLMEMFGGLATLPFEEAAYLLLAPLALFLGPLGALGILCLLWQTLGRYRVRRIQLLRVVAYTSTTFFIRLALLLLTFIIIDEVLDPISTGEYRLLIFLGCWATLPGLLSIFVSAGLKHYLQLPQPWLHGCTASFVGYLFSFAFLVIIQMIFRNL
ncbi:MAG: transposase family protein [Planctomycetota bacterium]